MTDKHPASPVGATVAVIGLGRMGVRHAEAAERVGMKIVGLMDVAEAALPPVAERFSVPASGCFTDAAAMLEAVKPDAVVIATTAPSHCNLVLTAAKAGIPYILCEKPMGASLAEGDAMIAATQASGSVLGINHQMRFMEQYTKVKALLDGEAMGPLVTIIVAASNFGLAMNASHYFEMFRYIVGQPVDTVQAWLEPDRLANPRGPQFDDRSGRILARSAAGTTMFMDLSARAGWGMQVIYTCRNGQIVVDELNGVMRVGVRKAEHRDLPTTRYGMPADITTEAITPADSVGPTVDVWNAMFRGQDFPDAQVGMHALSCLVAAHVSDRAGGQAVSLTAGDLPRDEIFKWA
ncbi:Gfo/Idh/MocA family protein [Brevundimonas fluminis]|uniref:Gfo/Idh/MocA family protein n=1 Tax=Brevundimonas fluminis TaxID=2487274 RepID=UPI0013DDE30C|nr:Gfo/Idh/MocA family oxidoreductase [Brevundimonas fluminis]